MMVNDAILLVLMAMLVLALGAYAAFIGLQALLRLRQPPPESLPYMVGAWASERSFRVFLRWYALGTCGAGGVFLARALGAI